MDPVTVWFNKEIFLPRIQKSIVSSTVVTLMHIIPTILLLKIDLWHPIQWIIGGLISVLTFRGIFYSAIISICLCFISTFHAHRYSVLPSVFATWLDLVWILVKPDQVVYLLLHAVLATFTSWAILGLEDNAQNTIIYKCNNDKDTCFNERYVFLILLGTFTGCVYAVLYVVENRNYVSFPIVQSPKLAQMKGRVTRATVDSAWVSLRYLKWYLVFYYTCGGVIYDWVTTFLKLKHDSSVPGLDSVSSLLDISLLWSAFLTAAFIHLTWSATVIIFSIYQTEKTIFPIELEFESSQQRPLEEALLTKSSLAQSLAFLDLSLVAGHFPARRKQIFTLSQPGGHAYRWNNLSTPCLTQLSTLLVQLQGAASGDPSQNGASSRLPNVDLNSNDNLRPHSHDVVYCAPLNQQLLIDFQHKRNEIVNGVKQWRPVAYFIAEMADTNTRRILAHCQNHIWAVDALSHLVVASINEDVHGVVQKSLPDIIAVMLDLQLALDKLSKLYPPVGRRASRDAGVRRDQQLSQGLRAALKAGLYRVVAAFQPYLCDIPLSNDHRRRVTQYAQFRE